MSEPVPAIPEEGGWLRRSLPSLLSVALALFAGWLAIALLKGDVAVATEAYAAMLKGGLGDLGAFLETGRWSTLTRPLGESTTKAGLLILTGLCVAVAFSAGLFNIGAQGQMMVGAIAAASVGAHLPLPGPVHALACLLVAAAVGGLYALVAAVLKVTRGVHEVISTIMLNWVAVSLIENWLVVGPLKAVTTGDHSRAGTDEILATAQLPRLLGDTSRLHLGFLLSLAAAGTVFLWLRRSRVGFEIRAVGLGAEAARASGIPVERRVYQAMAVSGALAGLAGALLVQGTEHNFPATLGAPYGFDGIAMSLIGGNHPFGVLGAASLFGVLRSGGTRMQLLGIHKSFPELIQGVALLLVAGKLIFDRLLQRRLRHSPTPAAPPPPAGQAPSASTAPTA